MDYGDRLERFDEEWEGIVVRSGSLPDGPHQARILEARVEEGDYDLQLVVVWEAVSGPDQGGTITKYYSLEDPERLPWLKQDMERLGFDLPKLSALPQLTPMLIDLVAEIKVQRKEYVNKHGEAKTAVNVYINKIIDTDIFKEPDVPF